MSRISGSYIWLQNQIVDSDGKVWIEGETSGTTNCYLYPATAIDEETTSFEGLTYDLTITTERVAADIDNADNDLKVGVWFNGKLYDGKFFYIKNCADAVAASVHLVRYTGSITLENPTPIDPVVTNETYNLSDGSYLVTGTGTITVNGQEKANGTRLTEPGEYQIISDNGRITRNVTLIDTGSTSTAITYEDGVMPIVG